MEKLYSMLGLARRANKLFMGRDSVIAAARTGKVKLVLLTSDASPRHLQELTAIGYAGTVCNIGCTMDDLAVHLGKKCCIFALEDANFSSAIQKLI